MFRPLYTPLQRARIVPRICRALQLSTALYSSLQLYSSTALYSLQPSTSPLCRWNPSISLAYTAGLTVHFLFISLQLLLTPSKILPPTHIHLFILHPGVYPDTACKCIYIYRRLRKHFARNGIGGIIGVSTPNLRKGMHPRDIECHHATMDTLHQQQL